MSLSARIDVPLSAQVSFSVIRTVLRKRVSSQAAKSCAS